MPTDPGDYDVTLNQAQAPLVGEGNIQNNYFLSGPLSRKALFIGPALLIVAGGMVAGVLATAGHGSSGPSVGPEVAPPVPYSHSASIRSASGLAVEERLSTDQAGDTAASTRPADTSAQRWAFWYGSNQGDPDDRATLLEADRTVARKVNGGGAVLTVGSNGTVSVQQVTRSPGQFWVFRQAGDGRYEITNQEQCLTAVQPDAPLQVRSCNGTPGQRWTITTIAGQGSTPTGS